MLVTQSRTPLCARSTAPKPWIPTSNEFSPVPTTITFNAVKSDSSGGGGSVTAATTTVNSEAGSEDRYTEELTHEDDCDLSWHVDDCDLSWYDCDLSWYDSEEILAPMPIDELQGEEDSKQSGQTSADSTFDADRSEGLKIARPGTPYYFQMKRCNSPPPFSSHQPYEQLQYHKCKLMMQLLDEQQISLCPNEFCAAELRNSTRNAILGGAGYFHEQCCSYCFTPLYNAAPTIRISRTLSGTLPNESARMRQFGVHADCAGCGKRGFLYDRTL